VEKLRPNSNPIVNCQHKPTYTHLTCFRMHLL